MLKILFEGLFVGLITSIIGFIVIKYLNYYNNNIYVLFITGFIIHIILEMLGINTWYCNNKCNIV
jgi:hypothetical protein